MSTVGVGAMRCLRCGVCDAIRCDVLCLEFNAMRWNVPCIGFALLTVDWLYYAIRCDAMRCDACMRCHALADSIRFDSIHSYCIALLASSYSIVSYCHRAVWTTDRSIHSTQLNSTQAKSSQLARCCLYVSFFLCSFVCLERRAVPHGATTLCSAMVIGWVG